MVIFLAYPHSELRPHIMNRTAEKDYTKSKCCLLVPYIYFWQPSTFDLFFIFKILLILSNFLLKSRWRAYVSAWSINGWITTEKQAQWLRQRWSLDSSFKASSQMKGKVELERTTTKGGDDVNGIAFFTLSNSWTFIWVPLRNFNCLWWSHAWL